MEIKRDIYLNKLISKKHNGFIKVVTGIQRCGKSCSKSRLKVMECIMCLLDEVQLLGKFESV